MKSDSCHNIKLLLIDKDISETSASDNKLINEHIENCSSCRAFVSEMGMISKIIKQKESKVLTPRRETLVNLNAHLKMKNIRSEMETGIIRPFIKTHFYPAFAAVVILLMVFFSVNSSDPKINPSSVDSTYYRLLKFSQPAVVNINTLKLQSGGKSIREDSLLLNYISASM